MSEQDEKQTVAKLPEKWRKESDILVKVEEVSTDARIASRVEAILNAAADLANESEEYEFPDGIGRGAQQEHWNALFEAQERLKNAGSPSGG